MLERSYQIKIVFEAFFFQAIRNDSIHKTTLCYLQTKNQTVKLRYWAKFFRRIFKTIKVVFFYKISFSIINRSMVHKNSIYCLCSNIIRMGIEIKANSVAFWGIFLAPTEMNTIK